MADFGWSVCDTSKRDTFCGTIGYISPEIAQGISYTEKCDNWAIGVLAYELLVGKSPFETSNQVETLENIKKGRVYYPTFLSYQSKNFIKNLLNLSSA